MEGRKWYKITTGRRRKERGLNSKTPGRGNPTAGKRKDLLLHYHTVVLVLFTYYFGEDRRGKPVEANSPEASFHQNGAKTQITAKALS